MITPKKRKIALWDSIRRQYLEYIKVNHRKPNSVSINYKDAKIMGGGIYCQFYAKFNIPSGDNIAVLAWKFTKEKIEPKVAISNLFKLK